MYPRNAASPPRLSLGAVVAIADGAVQTSDVSIKVRPEGGTASAGGGTTAYEEGIVLYTPTQAETNYTAFVVIAYKADCVPVSLAVVTTASATAGKAEIGTGGLTAASLDATVQARLGIVAYGTAQGATGTTLVLASATDFVDDELNGAVVVITGGSAGVGQSRVITDYVGSTDTATVDTWTTTPTGTITYVVFAAAPASATSLPAVNVTQVAGTVQTAGDLAARLPAALVSGRIDASVGAMAANVVTASALNADAVDEILDEVVEGSVTLRQALRVFLAALAGKVSGAASTTITFRDTGDATDRIVATVDGDGNRTAVTLTLT